MMDIFTLFISLTFSATLAALVQRLFIKLNKFDVINQRSSHSAKATRTGGISSFLTIFIISVYWYIKGLEAYDFTLLVPLSMMFIIGVYDDFYNADFKLKFFIQIIVAKMIIDQGLLIDNFHGVFGLYEISRISAQLFTVFVFLVIVNSINFIDGIDGLAITEIIKILITFGLLSYENSNLFVLGAITIASLLPLYYYNFKTSNKIFLGDAGSLFLGSLIAINTFYFLGPNHSLNFTFNKPFLSILILIYPLYDLLRVFVIRIKNKKSPFRPDNNHLHHLLLNKGFSHWKISIILPFGFSIFAILIGLLFTL